MLPDHPDIHNRSELQLIDKDPQARRVRDPDLLEKDKDKKMGADSVITMARVFNAGHVPGASLSDLQEISLMEKKKAKYVAMFQSNYGAKAGLNISANSAANLKARIARAKLIAENEYDVATEMEGGEEDRMVPDASHDAAPHVHTISMQKQRSGGGSMRKLQVSLGDAFCARSVVEEKGPRREL